MKDLVIGSVLISVLPAAEAFIEKKAEQHGCNHLEIVESDEGALEFRDAMMDTAMLSSGQIGPVTVFFGESVGALLDGMIFDVTTIGEEERLCIGSVGEILYLID